MNNLDVIYGFHSSCFESCAIKFVPPTAKEIRQQKWWNFKEKCIEIALLILMIAIQSLAIAFAFSFAFKAIGIR